MTIQNGLLYYFHGTRIHVDKSIEYEINIKYNPTAETKIFKVEHLPITDISQTTKSVNSTNDFKYYVDLMFFSLESIYNSHFIKNLQNEPHPEKIERLVYLSEKYSVKDFHEASIPFSEILDNKLFGIEYYKDDDGNVISNNLDLIRGENYNTESGNETFDNYTPNDFRMYNTKEMREIAKYIFSEADLKNPLSQIIIFEV